VNVILSFFSLGDIFAVPTWDRPHGCRKNPLLYRRAAKPEFSFSTLTGY